MEFYYEADGKYELKYNVLCMNLHNSEMATTKKQ